MHTPVLLKEAIQYLNPKPNENFIDCTLGRAGHALEILARTGPKGKMLGIDWDPETVKSAKLKVKSLQLEDRVTIVNDNFANLQMIVRRERFPMPHGILLDLGFSSEQIDNAERGFSFQKDGPLDMRYSPENHLKAATIVNYWSRQDIEKILKEYGEERFAGQIAKAIIEHRVRKEITRTRELSRIIEEAVPRSYYKERIHPATRTFQALRIAVNRELDNLREALLQAYDIAAKGGRIAVISFHSLEDRIVKQFMKEHPKLITLTKKPIIPQEDEIRQNPRARSAKLRVAQKQPI